MSRGSLNDAVRAAGYAMATSEELLGIPKQVTEVRRPETLDRRLPEPATAPVTKPDTRSSFKTFFSAWAVWA